VGGHWILEEPELFFLVIRSLKEIYNVVSFTFENLSLEIYIVVF